MGNCVSHPVNFSHLILLLPHSLAGCEDRFTCWVCAGVLAEHKSALHSWGNNQVHMWKNSERHSAFPCQGINMKFRPLSSQIWGLLYIILCGLWREIKVQRQFWDADMQSNARQCSMERLEQAGHRPSFPLSAAAQTKGNTVGKNPGELIFKTQRDNFKKTS